MVHTLSQRTALIAFIIEQDFYTINLNGEELFRTRTEKVDIIPFSISLSFSSDYVSISDASFQK